MGFPMVYHILAGKAGKVYIGARGQREVYMSFLRRQFVHRVHYINTCIMLIFNAICIHVLSFAICLIVVLFFHITNIKKKDQQQ